MKHRGVVGEYLLPVLLLGAVSTVSYADGTYSTVHLVHHLSQGIMTDSQSDGSTNTFMVTNAYQLILTSSASDPQPTQNVYVSGSYINLDIVGAESGSSPDRICCQMDCTIYQSQLDIVKFTCSGDTCGGCCESCRVDCTGGWIACPHTQLTHGPGSPN